VVNYLIAAAQVVIPKRSLMPERIGHRVDLFMHRRKKCPAGT
jgi:hypothetical protein